MNRLPIALLVFLAACRGDAPRKAVSLEQHQLDSLVSAIMPAVAQASGLEFRDTPRAAIRTKDEVRSYLLA